MDPLSRRSMLKLGGWTIAGAFAARVAGKGNAGSFIPQLTSAGYADVTLLENDHAGAGHGEPGRVGREVEQFLRGIGDAEDAVKPQFVRR